MTILAGTDEGVFPVDGAAVTATDGGSAPAVTLAAPAVRSLLRVGDRVLAGTGDGIHASDDRGGSWRRVGAEESTVWAMRPASPDAVIACTEPPRALRSDDRGVTWVELEGFVGHPDAAQWRIVTDPPLEARARALEIDVEDPDRIWVGIEVGGIMTSADGGRTWEPSVVGDNPDLHVICQDPGAPHRLFASVGYGRLDGSAEKVEPNAGVFRSDDRGRTWRYVWSGVTPRYARPMCIDHREPYGLTVAAAPGAFSSFRDEGGAGAMLLRSDDGGATWRSLCDDVHTPSRANVHGLTVDPDHPGGVLVGTDTGEIWRVGDDAVWQLLAEGLPAVLSLLADDPVT